MRKTLLLLALSFLTLRAQDVPASGRNLWLTSVTALAGANAMDIHSSWGKHELNSALAGSNGSFGARGALLKLGMQSGLVGIEYLITRGHPSRKLYRALCFLNFGAAAGIAGVAVHNYTVPGPPR